MIGLHPEKDGSVPMLSQEPNAETAVCETAPEAENTANETNRKPLDTAYRVCYITGLYLIKKAEETSEALSQKFAAAGEKFTAGAEALFSRVKSLKTHTAEEIKKPVREGFEWTLEMEEKFAAARKEGKTAQFLWEAFKQTVAGIAENVYRMRNYILPASAAVVFAFTFYYINGLTIALSVDYGGEHVGYVKNETDFDNAESSVKNRIIYEAYVYPEDVIPRFTLKVVDRDVISDEDELINNIIRVSGNELAEGYGLYIDSRFVGATDSEQKVRGLLDSILAKYMTDNPEDIVEFVKPVEIKEGLYPVSSVVDVRVLSNLINQDETESRTYTVQRGDVPTVIAQKYNMLYADLKKLNPEIETKLLVGQEVIIQRSVPLLGVQVIKTEVYNEDIPFKVIQIQDQNQLQGYTKVNKIGQKGVKEITAEVIYLDGIEVSRNVLDTIVLKEAVNEEMVVGGQRPLEQIPATARSTSTNFMWPVDGGYVSCGFYGYYNHGGMDIATKAGTAVRASASGTVELARYYTGNAYGKYVIINHGGGVKTLYAHNSEVYVEVGQWVEQGQLIAAVGRTGNATGNHCHFEIIINGVRQNPVGYIGNVYNR